MFCKMFYNALQYSSILYNMFRFGSVQCETYSDARELMRQLNKVVFKGRSLQLRIDQNLHKQQAGISFPFFVVLGPILCVNTG